MVMGGCIYESLGACAMAADTLTLELSGAVSLPAFAKAMQHFQALVTHLSNDISKPGQIDWRIMELSEGSALATVQGLGSDSEAIELVVRAYGAVGQALERREPILFHSVRVQQDARKLVNVIGHGVTGIRFETPFVDAVVSQQVDSGPGAPSVSYAYGEVRGTVET